MKRESVGRVWYVSHLQQNTSADEYSWSGDGNCMLQQAAGVLNGAKGADKRTCCQPSHHSSGHSSEWEARLTEPGGNRAEVTLPSGQMYESQSLAGVHNTGRICICICMCIIYHSGVYINDYIVPGFRLS
jgi:hypothetical protein